MVPSLEKEDLKRHILDRLVYSVGKDVGHAVPRDWCVALTLTIRDRLVDNWMETTRRIHEERHKRVYYLSMEFLIGRLLGDTISNLGLTQVCTRGVSHRSDNSPLFRVRPRKRPKLGSPKQAW